MIIILSLRDNFWDHLQLAIFRLQLKKKTQNGQDSVPWQYHSAIRQTTDLVRCDSVLLSLRNAIRENTNPVMRDSVLLTVPWWDSTQHRPGHVWQRLFNSLMMYF